MKLHRVGFFKEFPYEDPTAASLWDAISDTPYKEKNKIIEYLRNGILLVVVPGVLFDVLSGRQEPIGSSSILTDGKWAWPRSLVHYVDRYNVKLPTEFLEYIAARSYRAPDPNAIDLNELDV